MYINVLNAKPTTTNINVIVWLPVQINNNIPKNYF